MIFLIVVLSLFLNSNAAKPKPVWNNDVIDLLEISRHINNMVNNTWQADSYGYGAISKNDFISVKLGTLRKPKEFNSDGHIVKPRNSIQKSHNTYMPSSTYGSSNLPKNYDLRKIYPFCKSINYIWDQANCGSCWAISTVSALSDRLCILTNGTINELLSPEYVMSCDKGNNGCHGGNQYPAYRFLKSTGTVTGGDFESDEGCRPYSLQPCGYPSKLPCASEKSLTPKCRSGQCTNGWYDSKFGKKYKIENFYGLSRYDTDTALEEIMKYGSVVADMTVYTDLLTYKSGIYHHTYMSCVLGDHTVRVVGWGEENNAKYWIVANSWGKDWGENGFFRIKRGSYESSIESYMYGVTPLLDD